MKVFSSPRPFSRKCPYELRWGHLLQRHRDTDPPGARRPQVSRAHLPWRDLVQGRSCFSPGRSGGAVRPGSAPQSCAGAAAAADSAPPTRARPGQSPAPLRLRGGASGWGSALDIDCPCTGTNTFPARLSIEICAEEGYILLHFKKFLFAP